MGGLSDSRLHLVIGASQVLRDEAVAELIAAWTGPLQRAIEPADPSAILLGLDTPSLFEEPACWVLRCGDAWIGRHSKHLAPLIGQPVVGGVVVLVADRLPRRDRLASAARDHGAYHAVESPGPREIEGWLLQRLAADPAHIDHPRAVAAALLDHRGEDVDALASALTTCSLAAGHEPLTADLVGEVIAGSAQRPAWVFTDALLSGAVGKALAHLHRGLEPTQALVAVIAELRKCLACLVTDEDAEAARLAGMNRRGKLYHPRRRARELGRRCLSRLLTGALLCQRQLRSGGVDAEMAVETFVIQAQRVIRLGGPSADARPRRRRAS